MLNVSFPKSENFLISAIAKCSNFRSSTVASIVSRILPGSFFLLIQFLVCNYNRHQNLKFHFPYFSMFSSNLNFYYS